MRPDRIQVLKNVYYLIVVSKMVVRDSDGSGAHDSINKAIRAVREGVVINPDMAGTKDGDSITIGHGSPTKVGWRAANHRIASGFAVVDVETMDDDIGNKLNGYAPAISNVDICTTTIYGLEAVHDKLLLQSDHHVALENNPEGPVLDDSMPEGARPWVDRVVIMRISHNIDFAITTANCIASKTNPTVGQPLAA